MRAALPERKPMRGLNAVPRRILMTVDAVGGVWRYGMDLGKTLGRRGIEIVFVAIGPRPTEAQNREAEAIPNAQLVWFDEPLDWLVEREEDLDNLAPLLSRLVEEHGIDLLHLNLPSQAFRLNAPRPVVVVSHSCVVTWWHAVKEELLPATWRWQRKRNRGGFDGADIVLAPSRSHADLLQACYGPIKHLKVVPNAAEPRRSSAGKEPFVLAAGRWWDEGKNGRVLDLAARLCSWPVLMAGACTGPHGQGIELSHARALGELPNTQLRELTTRAAIVVSPSKYEPFGLVALEAACAGAALVLADIPTYRELWDDAALFAHPGNPEAFAAVINRLASDPELRSRLGHAAALRSRRFSPEAQADAVLEAYRAAAARSASNLAIAV